MFFVVVVVFCVFYVCFFGGLVNWIAFEGLFIIIIIIIIIIIYTCSTAQMGERCGSYVFVPRRYNVIKCVAYVIN